MENAIMYKGTTYRIGAQIVANEQSVYQGLYGAITGIQDSGDGTPEIHCSFEAPVLPCEAETFEKRFLAPAIMAPEMIDLLEDLEKCRLHPTVYVVMEEWGDDDGYNRVHQICTDHNDAKRVMLRQLKEAMEDDDIQRWREDDDFVEESTPDSYECYIDGEYLEKHYAISITAEELCMSDQFVGKLAKDHEASGLIEDFVSQMSQWDEVAKLTDEQYERMIHDPRLAGRVKKALDNNDSYWEVYWATMSEVGHELVKEYLHEDQEEQAKK